MSWGEILKIVLAILTSFGGIGGIFAITIKYSSNIIAKRLEEKYKLKMNKELEKYKSTLTNKTYISKTKFDTEFSIYRELSKAFFQMVKDISIMIPCGFATYPADEDKRKEYENEKYKEALDSTVLAQDELYKSSPFIPSNIFEKYYEIYKLCQQQLNVFEQRWNAFYLASQEEKEKLSFEDYQRTGDINTKFKELNEEIRKYLSKLDVLD